MKLSIALLFAAIAHGQPKTPGLTALGGAAIDLSAASATKNAKSGASDPGTCAAGEKFFNTTSALFKSCLTANAWTAEGSGGSGAGNYAALEDFALTKTSATVGTIGAAASASKPHIHGCGTGGVELRLTSGATATLSGTSASGTVYWYIDNNCTLIADEATTATLTCNANCTVATTGGVPTDAYFIAAHTFASNVYDTVIGVMDKRGSSSHAPLTQGPGMNFTRNPTTGALDVGLGLAPLAYGGTGTATPFAVLSKSATYQVLAADFTNFTTIIVPSGTFTITLVASGTQPAAGLWIKILNYGTGVVTVARSGQNINGGTTSLTIPAGSATAPTSAFIHSDGANYFASLSGAGGGSTSYATPAYYAPWGKTDITSGPQTYLAAANDVFVQSFTPYYNMTISKLAFYLGTASGTCGGTCGAKFAILDSTRTTKLVQSAVLTSGGSPNINGASADLVVNFASAINLDAGTQYWLSLTSDSIAMAGYRFSGAVSTCTQESAASVLIGTGMMGKAANAGSGTGASVAFPAGAFGTVTLDCNRHFSFTLGN